ncbi:MAG: SpoIID/LytB domain-containing protein [Oscillospiraceae bacterium]|nr:SpoIID/LytB domain-containing protein [Oscillospiraceae bacterium]
MKRKFVQIVSLCLSAALLLALGGEKATAAPLPSASTDRIIRVGLHYGTGAMEGLNLLNDVGSGFRFGYYDSANRFVELGSTQQKAISVVETMNVYYGAYSGYACYYTALTSSAVAVGEYHLQLPGVYNTFAEAQAAASAYPGGFPAYIGGAFYARVGNYTTRDGAVAAQSNLAAQGVYTELRGTSEYGVSVVITGTNTILFQYDDNGSGTGLGVEPASPNGEKCTTWSKERLYNGGFRFERIKGGKLTVVNILGLEDYVKGVVPNEMSNSWPIEALKAQAVAARSYALSLGTKHSAHHFDICFDVDCQAYYGRAKAGANSDAAVDQTAGQVAIYNGKLAQTFYYSSNGGASESVSTVWGSNQASYPYLVGKIDPYEAAANINNSWTYSISGTSLAAKLRGIGYNSVGSSIISIAVASLTDSGNPRQITFTDSNGKNFTIDSRYVVNMLGLRSYRYGFDAAATQQQPPAAPAFSVNGTTAVSGTDGLYAIDSSGNVVPVAADAYVITDSGTSPLSQSGGTTGAGGNGLGGLSSTTGSNGAFTFVGKGWGHNVGMSQFGAKAMAEQGHTYLQILQFYYTGITVGYT